MREIGKIKWFGGLNRNHETINYGFIERKNKEDLFIHKRNVLSNAYLKEGDYVSFEIKQNKRDQKEQAGKLKLLKDDQDKEIIEQCAKSNDYNLIELVLDKYFGILKNEEKKKYIEKVLSELPNSNDKISFSNILPIEFSQSPEILKDLTINRLKEIVIYNINKNILISDEIVIAINDKLNDQNHSTSLNKLIKEFPLDFLLKHDSIFNMLDVEDRFELVYSIINKKDNLLDNQFLYKHFLNILRELESKATWEKIDKSILTYKDIWDCAPNFIKLKFYLDNSTFNELEENDTIIEKIKSIFLDSSSDERKDLSEILPDNLKQLRFFIPFLNEFKQLKYTWDSIKEKDSSVWNLLTQEAKILAIFKAISESINISVFKNHENNETLKYLLEIMELQTGEEMQQKFDLFHDTFVNNVIEIAWDINIDINFKYFLPVCKNYESGVEYCEGRPWPTDEDKTNNTLSRIFCPKIGFSCPVNIARVKPNLSLPFNEWSLMEFFEYYYIDTYVKGLTSKYDYIPKLSGWINRLNEIRERLKCSVCGNFMKPNYKYAKNLAKYNVTVVSCLIEDLHDKNIYLNHCWSCRNIIDSRESSFQYEDYYLCIHCGSGPQKSETFSQGDICPKCGGKKTMNYTDKTKKQMRCSNCNHVIKMPHSNKITGKSININKVLLF